MDWASAAAYLAHKLPVHPTMRYNVRPLGPIIHLVWHHTATIVPVTVQAIARYHVSHRDRNGKLVEAPGIRYHAVLTRAGVLYLTQPWAIMSWHIASRNANSIGVAVEGDFRDGRKPTLAQRKVLPQVGSYLLEALNETRVTPGRRITQVGHGDHAISSSPTSCPGNLMEYV